ncbi:M48 family metallopeptidase [Aurantiacibacter gangjinensis]|uniref:Peptidase M48 n=1 Tax=Aurantiacibacter gangjinensis TaxID=502682 RepID=A0A0G9MKB0_9SPHN|nr:M48 family metallopeptidase [Aurantiacibacter gangjinensis]APE29477.1 Zn-dependent protease with chaperone function [Aurantiacibacter gangjinensis]KLE31146.1 peptidase M48 [Aurantiacibacter gangjinensis]
MQILAAAATQEWMATLSAEELALARDYTTGNHWLILWGLVVSALVTWVIVRWGVLDRVAAYTEKRWLRILLVATTFLIISTLLTLPWSIYTDWWRETQYDRTSQPLSDFVAQGAIGLVLSAVIGAIFLLGVYWLLRKTGRFWWAWAGGLVASLVAFMLLLSPILIEPLFNDYQPIPEGEVRDAVLELAAEAGVPEDRVFMYDGSRQSNNFTANVSGVGGSARIAISDVAMDEASLDEVKAVTGHEIGHYVLGHVWRSVLVLSVLAIFLFWLTDRLYPRFARWFGTDAEISDIRGLPVFLFVLGLLSTLAGPVTNTLTRVGEREADAYSLATVGLPDALAGALIKTAEYRYPLAGPVEETLFYTHPTVENRIRTAMEWKLANQAGTE